MILGSSPLPAENWNASDDFDPIPYEKVVGLNNLLSIAWLSQGLTLAGAVARIVLPDGVGTGFLVAPDLLLTNHHVLGTPETATAATVQFNYQDNWGGVRQASRSFPLDASRFRTNPELDYSLVRVTGSPGEVYGHIDLGVSADPSVNDYVSIIQHPAGGPKQICLTDNKVSAVFDHKLQYATDTESGSSGAPVFNQAWQLVGLHHAGGGLAGPDGQKYFTNEGIVISRVIADAADFLGFSDPVYDQVFGDMRAVLVNLVDQVDPPPTPSSLLPDVLWTRPAFAAALDQWSRLNTWAASDPAAGFGAVGTAAGAALRQWARSAGHESITATAPSTPPPTPALVAKVSGFNGSSASPREVYGQVLAAVRGDATLLPPLAGGGAVPAEPAMVVAARAFLTGVTVGAAAFDPAPSGAPGP